MKNIKSFYYLDEYKMYSLFSQMFEGLTYHLTNKTISSTEDITSQKGPHFSGRELANLIESRAEFKENKILHDYAFNLFLEKLNEENMYNTITVDNIQDKISHLNNHKLIAVKGTSSIYDMESLNKTMTAMPSLTTSLNYITTHSYFRTKETTKQKNKKETPQITSTVQNEIDERFTNHLLKIFEYHYSNYTEIQTRFSYSNNQIVFTSIIDQSHLREGIGLFLKKFGRTTQKEITIFGTITQSPEIINQEKTLDPVQNNKFNMKNFLRALISNLEGLELEATGREENEVIIDPIAIYYEL